MSLTFCGASVRSFSANIGWNDTQSQFRCSVVEDPGNGDFFNPPPAGTPIFFTFGAFSFQGLLQRWVRTNDVSGFPTYELECVDPRGILAGVEVITSGYYGVVPVNNVQNPFGWWENGVAFGSSLSNEGGMPYNKIIQALSTTMNSVTSFGSYANYKGVLYGVDFSQLPVPPSYYRVSASTINLMQLISDVCQDCGADYFVELNGYTIVIRAVSRVNQLPLGVISSLQGTGYGVDLVKSSAGIEARNELTTNFVVGGQVHDLLQTDTIQPYWGLDIDGNPILGQGTGDAQTANLNSADIADITGSTVYQCNVLEMRCALESYETWTTYMMRNRVTAANIIGLAPITPLAPLANNAQPVFQNDTVNLGLSLVTTNAQSYARVARAHRVYEFVRNYATEYYGKKFLVSLPFLLSKLQPDTLKVVHSYDVADGGYLPEGVAPLGLPPLVQDQFKLEDGRFTAFCLFKGLLNIDLSRLQGGDFYIASNGIYMKVQIESRILGIPGPAVVMTVSNPIYDLPVDRFGDTSLVAPLLNMTTTQMQSAPILRNIAGGTGIPPIHPRARQPDIAAIPLKSNIKTYGPWYLEGAPGKARVEQDSSLVPWEYGGYTLLQQAGLAKVVNSITFMQEVETGTKELVGAPIYNLGDSFQGSGPNVTGMDITYSERGILTNYRMTTFTPPIRYGVFTKDAAERIRRLGRTVNELSKALRASANARLAADAVRSTAYAGYTGWMSRMPSYISRRSPHTTLVAYITNEVPTTTLSDNEAQKRVSIASGTLAEIRSGCGADDGPTWHRTAIMSLTGLLRPFNTTKDVGEVTMSHYSNPKTDFNDQAKVINTNAYNPFSSDCDLNELAWGDTTYPGAMNSYIGGQQPDALTTRVMALRGPLVVSGWGWTIDNKNVPGNSAGEPAATFVTGFKKKSQLWKTGPVDLLWDDNRGVWTVHDLMSARTGASLPGHDYAILPRGDGMVTILNQDGGSSAFQMKVYNLFNAGIDPNVNIVIGYMVNENKWRVIAVDCAA